MTNLKLFDALQLASLTFAALALVPAGAHFFELPSKMGLPPEQYMIVQNIYRGWALFGIVLFGSLTLTIIHTVVVRGNTSAMMLSGLSAICLVASLIVFFSFTYPMNVASNNWTVMPPDFQAARRQWEYSHAFNAILMLVAFAALALSVLASRGSGGAALHAAAE